MNVQRWSFYNGAGGPMVEDDEGEYVLYSDYEKAMTPAAPRAEGVDACPHEAWEDNGGARHCADCREYLGSTAALTAEAPKVAAIAAEGGLTSEEREAVDRIHAALASIGNVEYWHGTGETGADPDKDSDTLARIIARVAQPAAQEGGDGVTEAMAKRYLEAQRAYLFDLDQRQGRSIGAIHTDHVIAACMAGLTAALAPLFRPVEMCACATLVQYVELTSVEQVVDAQKAGKVVEYCQPPEFVQTWSVLKSMDPDIIALLLESRWKLRTTK